MVRETGTLRGQTFDKPLRFAFIDDTATSRIICEGARVQTAGGSSSNAPPGLPIGKVTKVVDDEQIEIEIAEGVRARLLRAMVSSVRSKGEPAKDESSGG